MEQKEETKTYTVKRKKSFFGYLLIIIGMLFLFQRIFSFHFIDYIAWGYLWPLALIFWGGYLVIKKADKRV